MIKIYQKTIKDSKLKTLSSFRVGCWLHVENPDKEELEKVAEKFSLDRGHLADAVDPHEVPRIEAENSTTYVFTRVPYKEHGHISTSPLLIGVAKDFIFTVSPKPISFMDKLLDGTVELYTTQKVKLFTQIFSQVNAAYNTFITDIHKQVRSSTAQLEKIDNKDIVRFVVFERILNDFLASLTPINTILSNLLSGKFLKLYEEDHNWVEDVFLASGQLIRICQLNLKSIVNIRESYSTIITNNLNKVIKLLTALTVVLTVPTMMASFYGMNVALPYAESPLAFGWIVGITAVVSLAILGIFIRNRWL